jgi:hypothetical protein
MKSSNFLFTAIVSLFAGVFIACNDQEPENARLVVRLIDSPADYQEVNVDIQAVEVNTSENGSGSGWVALGNTNPGVYNLLELTNGLSVVLADAEIPAGYISQIRLILGDENTLKMDDQIHDLSTPSSQQSGLKLQLKATLIAGITYEVFLDFDAARSVVESGNSGRYNLKPVIRAIAEAQDGAIGGIILPLDATPAVYAIQGSDTITSAFTDSNGAFLLQGLEAGSYTVGIDPSLDYLQSSKENVQVSIGEVTDIGTIQLSQ